MNQRTECYKLKDLLLRQQLDLVNLVITSKISKE